MPRPRFGDLVTNFRAHEAPLATKIRLALANNWTKLRSGSNCCGHHGQPGC